jgi:signal transduction histidine kinase
MALWVVLAVLVIVLLGASLFGGRALLQSSREAEGAERSHQALEVLSRLTVVLLDVQQKLPAVRTGPLTGVQDIENAEDAITEAMTGLSKVEGGDPADHARLRELRDALVQLLAALEDRRVSLLMDDDDAFSAAGSNEPKALPAALRLIEDIETGQRALGIQHEEALRQANNRVMFALSAALLDTAALQVVIWLIVRAYRRRRALIEHDLRRSNEGLEASLAERNATLASANRDLAVLSERLLKVQESERRRIALELHDHVGQQLAVLLLNLRVAQADDEAEGNVRGAARLRDWASVVQATYEQIHDLALELRPMLLDQLGLVPTLEWFAREQGARTGCSINVRGDALPDRLASDIATASFRIVQEAVTNALRHAQPRNIDVVIRREAGSFDLSVRDNGKGFDATNVQDRGGLGLLGMRERAMLAGGSLSIRSHVGEGTEVSARLPLAEEGFAAGRDGLPD